MSGASSQLRSASAKRAGMKKAKVALARKLAVVLHRMLANGTIFMVSQGAGARAGAGAA